MTRPAWNPRDLEAITTMIDVAAITCAFDSPDESFTFDALMAVILELCEGVEPIAAEDVRIVLPRMRYTSLGGGRYRWR